MKESRELTQRAAIVQDLSRSEDVAVPAMPVVTYGVENATEDEIHLRDYWRAVRKRLWLVLGVAALVTLLTAIYMARKPDIYEAQARVQVDLERNPALSGVSKNSPVIFNGTVNDPAYFNTQLQILTGPALLRRVAKTLDLEHNQSFLRPQSQQNRSTWQSLLKMVGVGSKDKENEKNRAVEEVPLTNAVAPATSREDLAEARRLAPFVGALQAGLKVEPVKETRASYVKDTRLIDVRFSHSDPQIAAKVTNAIVEAFVLLNLEKKNETSTSTSDYLEKRIAELQNEIRTGEERLANYARNNQILSLDASQNTVVERLAGLNKNLLEAENERSSAEAAYRAAQRSGAAEALIDGDGKSIAQMEEKLAELRQKRAELLVENTEEWPEVKEIQQQINVIEKQVQDTRSRASSTVLKNLETRYIQAKSKEDALRADFNKQKGETLTQNEAAIQYRIIQQENDTNKELLNGLLQRSKENDVVAAGTPNNIYVVDYALTPEGPIGPARLRTVFLSMIVSLGFGVGLALFLEYLDDTVHSTDDVEKMLHLPALAVIPSASASGRRRLMAAGSALQARNGNGNGSSGNSELLVNVDARSPLAEAYRQLRTSVLLSTAGRAPKSLLVTSSLPGEGKTTTAVNTAYSLAQTGASVVIIDADMRRPRLHSIFDVGNRKGLSTILSSEMSEAEMLGTIENHESSGLHVLTSGPIPPNPAELIGSEQMRRLIRALESTFSHIVVDSPPISSFTDGVLVSSMVDGVLLVVHGGKSSRHVVKRSRQLLQDVGAKIFGVVLNNVNLRAHDYYYYHRYYQESSYYQETEDGEHVASGT